MFEILSRWYHISHEKDKTHKYAIKTNACYILTQVSVQYSLLKMTVVSLRMIFAILRNCSADADDLDYIVENVHL